MQIISFTNATNKQIQTAYNWAGGQHEWSRGSMIAFMEKREFVGISTDGSYTKAVR